MAEQIVIHGRKVVGGKVAAEALVSHEAVGGFSSLNGATGTYTERSHELSGQVFAGKVLVFPNAKGSSGWSSNWKMTKWTGKNPVSMLVTHIGTRSALGAVEIGCPTMTDFDIDPTTVIDTGDWVEVDADAGLVVVIKK